MRYLSICSGIEAATVAWHPLGWTAVGFSEIEAFPSAVLAHRYGSNMPGEPLATNGVPNYGDFTGLIDNPPDCDVLVGGTPCQAFSIAGQRRSLEDERGNLTLQFVRLAHAIGSLRWVVWENVPGVLSTDDNAFGCFLGGLVGADDALRSPLERGRWPDIGMVAGPRARLAWRVLDAQYFGLAQRRRRVFVVAGFGGGGDPAAVLFERKSLRRDTATGRKEGKDIAPTISARTRGGGGLGTDFECDGGLIATCLTAGAIETFDRQSSGEYGEAGIASTVSARDYKSATDLVVHPDGVIAFPERMSGTQCASTADLSPALGALNPTAVASTSCVRRLTPRECERLQGFPDDYTAIPWRGREASACPDGPRYKALGNSMAVPVMRWIGERIAMQEGGL